MEKIRLNINGKEVCGFPGQTILAVAQENGIEIPTLCYDQRMEIYGSCGLCVVEMEGSNKLFRACATQIADGMIVKTDTQRVRESRKTNLELLLSNHVGDCRPPCALACPAHTDCQGYVGLIANGANEEALKLIKDQIPLPASIGRVCPHPCETACRRKLVEEPISILNLKRYAADIDLAAAQPYLPQKAAESGCKVAVIGGGPGGLSAAYYLAVAGHQVTVFDAAPKMGGMLRYGIPEYRLPKAVLDKEIALIAALGVTLRNNVKIGRDNSIASLQKEYDAVLVAIGAWTSSGLRCPGEELPGVYGGIHFLRQVVANEPVTIGKKVAVVGGGNTAMDACRTAVRLGAEQVYNIYRRTKDEMPAEKIEIEEAEQEGVLFQYLVNPLEILPGKNGQVKKIRLQKMELGEPDASGRRRPMPITGAEEILDVDTVIAAIGQGVDPAGIEGVDQTKWQTIVADENTFATNLPGVFAIGDCVNKGASIAIEAIADAKKAVTSINQYLDGKEIAYQPTYVVERDDLTAADFADRKKEHRSQMAHLTADERKDNFLEFNQGFTAEQAKKDAARCLECGCHDYFECKLIRMANQYQVQPARFQESVLKHPFRDNHPFIVREPDKCILCSLCVRVCADMIGSGALGLVDRGFKTVVLPALGDSLAETSCISCGECISVCPTGALGERAVGKKSVPLATEKTPSVCGMCSLGCAITLESKGDLLLKAVPHQGGVNNGVMCGKGRFGVNFIQSAERITAPMLKKNGKLTETTWQEACVYAAKKLESLKIRGEKLACAIGQNQCLDDAAAIQALAQLFDAQQFSYANRENGLAKVLGVDASPNGMDELLSTEQILILGTSLLGNPVLLSKLRQAAAGGVKITVLAQTPVKPNLEAQILVVADSTAFLKELVQAALTTSKTGAAGLAQLQEALAGVTPSAAAQELAQTYSEAKRAMLLYHIADITPEAAVAAADLAVVTGHIGSPRNGIVLVRQMAGSQVLADLGITAGAEAAKGAKGLLLFGEEVKLSGKAPEFLLVADSHWTAAAKKADVVLPLPTYAELDGIFVNSERRVQEAHAAVAAPAGLRAEAIAKMLAAVLETEIEGGCPCRSYPGWQAGEAYPAPVLACADPVLQPIPDAPLFATLDCANYLMHTITAHLPQPKQS